MTKEELKPLIEALIFAADHPVSLERLAGVLEGEEREDVKSALKELIEDYRGRGGIYIEEVAGGYQFRTRPGYAPWLRTLFKMGMQRASKASLETLSIVAYRQPITRAELESIRGVDSAGVLRTLLERRLIKIVGRKEEPGRPVVYGTTKEFLETFSLKDLAGLPTLKDLEVLDENVSEEEWRLLEDDTGKTAKDNIQSGDNVQAEGGGTDTRGEGKGQP